MRYTPLDQETRSIIPTREAAYHLNRQKQTLHIWACKGTGPIHPVRVGGRLAWRVADIRRVLNGGDEECVTSYISQDVKPEEASSPVADACPSEPENLDVGLQEDNARLIAQSEAMYSFIESLLDGVWLNCQQEAEAKDILAAARRET